ncbi:MAG: hypothetical protein EPO27_09255 [Betaproteobacteria bacterium]|nr:MAG: hypothetical protein EPO27_09255 [Betaproteobacteria bacterium]
MSEWTGQEISTATDELELAAATILGRILFEFGHLEMELALFLVWADNGSNLETLTDAVREDALHAKLCKLEKRVNATYGSSPSALAEFKRWLEEAHAARAQRNEFIHGRWGVAAVNRQVVNVIGIPTSPEQREIRYSIAQLEESLVKLKALRPQLRRIRSKWPL